MANKYNDKNFEPDQQIQFLFDTTPLACQLWDKDLNVLMSNDENTKLFQIKEKQTFHDDFVKFLPEYQPDGQRSDEKAYAVIKKTFSVGKYVLNWRFKTLDGTSIPTKITLIKVPNGKDYVIIAYINDLREHNQLLKEIAERDNLLHTVNDVAATLLTYKEDSFEAILQKGIEHIGHGLNVNRVYIWKNRVINDDLYYVSMYEWVDSNKEQGLIVRSEMKYPYKNTPRWERELGNNRCINGPVKDFPQYERKILTPYNLKSLLVIPVHLDTEFWGFISFDDCKNERQFSHDEVNILRSACLIIVNSIVKHEMNLNMNESAKKLENALQKAQYANDAKSSFLSTMSHEIRTPMNAIIGMTKIGKSAIDVEKMIYALDKIDLASKHLLGVINDILDMSKIEANKLTLSNIEFNFEKMVRSTVSIINFRTEEKQQRLYVYLDKDIPTNLKGDDQRLSQVITNLLSNAVKFTPAGNSIYLYANLDQLSGKTCTLKISVKDTGIGITKEQQTKLFSSFQQAESGTSRKYGGTGLGLAISKHIVELMNGEIWIESEKNKGATFSFTVEMETGAEKPEKSPLAGFAYEDVRLLFVSDDLELSDYFLGLSHQLGINCDIASDAETALNSIDNNIPYNICFIDWDMENVNHQQLCHQLFMHKEFCFAFVMISWYNKVFVEQDYKSCGIEMFLSKPLFKSSIAQCIKQCLANNPDQDMEASTDEDIVSLKGFRLLLAEDIEINREIMLAMLEPTQIDVDYAENGLEAVRMCENNTYDIILMDIKMPVMDGYEATKKIREIEGAQTKKTPIIAMTANVFREDIERCLDAGMNGHLGKPLDTDKMLDVLYKFLN